MTAVRQKVELLEKNKPRQERAKRTYESILTSAAALLVEVGVERISTNLIAERAGITVPALYRYFPNKYAVLHALGAMLMDEQNDACQLWFESHNASGDPAQLLDNVYDLLRRTYDVTLEQTGGLEIIQSLRAVAPLQELRLTSHQLVADQLAEALEDLVSELEPAQLSLAARMSVDMGYAAVEMALEDRSLDADAVMREGANMIRAYWQGLVPGSDF